MLGSDGQPLYRQTYFHMGEIPMDRMQSVENIIYRTNVREFKWIEHSTEIISEWRYRLRSSYTRWCLCINGLYVAQECYDSAEWKKPEKRFYVSSFRLDESHQLQKAPIAIWEGPFTAAASIETVPMLCAWASIDMFRCIEEFIFSLYRVYLKHHPVLLLKGREYWEMRKLLRNSSNSPEDAAIWKAAFEKRLNSWQRKKLYEGLKKVFLAYCDHTSVKQPSSYKNTTPEHWADTIDGISLLRNSLTHGCKIVPKELADFSTKPHRMTFDFELGQKLEVNIYHLMGIELFCDQLFSALNLSLIETAGASTTR